jgi:hypothetical protein
VRLPDDTVIDGFLGLYDNDIAIVTSLGLLDVAPIDLDYKPRSLCSDDVVLAVGRAFSSGSLGIMAGSPFGECDMWVPRSSNTTKVCCVCISA